MTRTLIASMLLSGCAATHYDRAPALLPYQAAVTESLTRSEAHALVIAILQIDCELGAPVISDEAAPLGSLVLVQPSHNVWPLLSDFRVANGGGILRLSTHTRGLDSRFLATLIIHEFGHAMGLIDSDDESSVMRDDWRVKHGDTMMHPVGFSAEERRIIRKLHDLPDLGHDVGMCRSWVREQIINMELM